MENVRARVNVKFVTNERSYKLLVKKPGYKRNIIMSDVNKIVGVEMQKESVKLNKPIYLGFCILEYSKLLMQEFHYDYIKKRYGNKAQLLFTDTDSLCYNIKTDDIYKDMLEDEDLFDFSNYPEDHPNFSNKNKKVVGKMKDECAKRILTEFCGLKSKVYSLKFDDGSYKNTCKGVQKCVTKDDITFDDYVHTLNTKISQTNKVTRIMSTKHNISLVSQNKISLSCYDDKRYILDDGITTLAYGHYKIGA